MKKIFITPLFSTIRTFLLVISFLFFGNLPISGQAPNPGVTLATAILEQVGSHAAKQAMIKMGLDVSGGVLPAIQQLQASMDLALKKLDAIRDQITEESFLSTYTSAQLEANGIQTELGIFNTWVNDDVSPTVDMLDKIKTNLSLHITNIKFLLNDGAAGLLVKLMNAHPGPAVTSQYSYWEELDYFRNYYTVALAKAVIVLEAVADYQRKKWEKCHGGPETATSPTPQYEFVGSGSTSCRAGFNNEGSPTDPIVIANPNNNKYYTVKTYNTLKECQEDCLRTPGCTGIEYHPESKRGELWKVPIRKIQTSSYGYTCMEKRLKPPTATGVSTSDPVCNAQVPRVSDATVAALNSEARVIVRDMYKKWGVPLMENRDGSKFVHVKDQPWALSPQTSFSGYFGTATGTRLRDKLRAMADAYRPELNGNKTLEQFLDENQIPTRYFDQSTWQCARYGSENFSGRNVRVKADMIIGNKLITKEIVVGEGSNGTLSACETEMNRLKNLAGQNSGLYLTEYWDDICGDCSLCKCPGNKVICNRKFYGKFFTYNLTKDDCTRIQTTYGAGSKQYMYCDLRLNPAGRATLMTDAAVDDYLRKLAGN